MKLSKLKQIIKEEIEKVLAEAPQPQIAEPVTKEGFLHRKLPVETFEWLKSWYDNGERWYLSDAELKLLNQYSETFLVSDPDVEALLSHYDFFNCSSWKATLMNTICAHIRLDKPTKAQIMRLAEAIRKYNGGQRPKLVNGINHHYVPDTGLMGRSPVPWVQTTGSGT
jgi:hypothetical protein